MSFEDVLVQVFQPYFYYSVIALVISFVCIKTIVKCFPFMGSKTKSLIYLIPIAAPLLVMFSIQPKILIQTLSYRVIGSYSIPTFHGPMPFNPFHMTAPTASQATVTIMALSTNQVLSITGIICITGLALGGVYALTTILLGDWIASRLLHVIDLGSNEYEWLQTEIAAISKKLPLPTPKVAVVEDLRPNAFTMGFGRRTKIVFTMGLLNILEEEEILAVASHELAHVKNHDFLFKTLSNALTAVSFFNPLAFLALFNSQREREMLADENGAKLLQKPDSLANALTKITAALQRLPREGRFMRLSTNLLVTSPIIHKPQILSGHPKIDLRLKNIHKLTHAKPKRLKPTKLIVAALLACIVIAAGVTATFALVNVQSVYGTPKIVIGGATYLGTAYVKGASGNAVGNQIILINSNVTFNPTLAQLTILQDRQTTSPWNHAQVTEHSTLNPNQPDYMMNRATPVNPRTTQPKITIIYSLTNENVTTIIIKN